ncbi:hypothetical protein OZZ08_13785 [Malaciobacter mytili]|uniref:hypothetical protein n=1 Tax=Malaciobacter mytili TaxID=603050 RepID=UPI003BB10D29
MSKKLHKLQVVEDIHQLSKKLLENTKKITSLYMLDEKREFLRIQNEKIENELLNKISIASCMKGF